MQLIITIAQLVLHYILKLLLSECNLQLLLPKLFFTAIYSYYCPNANNSYCCPTCSSLHFKATIVPMQLTATIAQPVLHCILKLLLSRCNLQLLLSNLFFTAFKATIVQPVLHCILKLLVGNMSGYRCVSDCNSRGRQLDPGPLYQTFMEIDHEIISTVILLHSADSFKKGCCQLQAKVYVHELLVIRLFKPAQEKSVVR